MDDYIRICNVQKRFKQETVIDNVSLEIEKGAICGFVGPNGSGKTMLFKMVAGIIRPDAGQIFVDHKEIGKEIDFPAKMGLMIETPGFLKQYNGFQNLKYLARIRNQISDQEIREAMEEFGLKPDDRKRVGKYSLGMKQRLGIVQAIMEKPELLILDEPMNSLDEANVEILRRKLKELSSGGVTVLLSSHHKEDIELLCEKVYEMKDGKIKNVAVL